MQDATQDGGRGGDIVKVITTFDEVTDDFPQSYR